MNIRSRKSFNHQAEPHKQQFIGGVIVLAKDSASELDAQLAMIRSTRFHQYRAILVVNLFLPKALNIGD